MLATLKGLLGHHALYVGLQKALGADRLRYRCLDELALRDGETVLDVGCGPAYYLGRLAKVRYFGFDTSQRYIEHARSKWGNDRVTFECAVFGPEHLAEVGPVDAVMLLGLLHHLSDEESRALLRLAAQALAPGGRVIAVDTCFEPNQGRISRWMSRNDRGEYVREPAGFTALARECFADVDGEVLSTTTRIPSCFWMMRMASPTRVATTPAAPTATG
jgi:SAM-dependent methyltransferase